MTIPRRLWVTLAWLATAALAPGSESAALKQPWTSDHPIPRPELFEPGFVSTGFDDSHAVFSPDGRELYFLRNTPDFAHWTVLVTRFDNAGWSPLEVAPFSGRYNDADVSFSRDGKTMFFVSTRPIVANGPEREDTEIWTIKKTAGGWTEPEHIDALSSPGDEYFPVVSDSGNLYFGSERPGGKGKGDIWMSRRVNGRYTEPVNLGDAINTPEQEVEAWVAPDESVMILAASGRKDSLGSYDFYVTRNCGGSWTPPKNLGEPVNSRGWELSPRFTPDGKYFLFTSSRSIFGMRDHRFSLGELHRALGSPGNGLRDIYRMDASALSLGAPCGSGSGSAGAVQKGAIMTGRAKGPFEVKMTVQPPGDKGETTPLGRMNFDKQFHGDLEGTSKGEMLSFGTGAKGTSGAYVAIEMVSATLHGRKGTFALQHSATMTRGSPQLSVTVVPDSGTDELRSLAGKMAIIIADGKHSYDFEYTIADTP